MQKLIKINLVSFSGSEHKIIKEKLSAEEFSLTELNNINSYQNDAHLLFLNQDQINNETQSLILEFRKTNKHIPVFILYESDTLKLLNTLSSNDHIYFRKRDKFTLQNLDIIIQKIISAEQYTGQGILNLNDDLFYFTKMQEAGIICDIQGNIFRVNNSICKLVGYSAPDLLLKNISDLLPEFEKDFLNTIQHHLLIKNQSTKDIHLINRSGQLIPVQVHAFLKKEDENQILHLMLKDLSEIYRAENVQKQKDRIFYAIDSIVKCIVKNQNLSDLLIETFYTIEKVFQCESALLYLKYREKELYTKDRVEKKLINFDWRQMPDFFPGLNKEKINHWLDETNIRYVSLKHTIFEPGNYEDFVEHGGMVVIPLIHDNKKVGVLLCKFLNPPDEDLVNNKTLKILAELLNIAVQQNLFDETLKKSELQYSGLVNNALNGIYKSSDDGKLLFANQAFIEMLEYSSWDEIKSVDLIKVYFHPNERVRFIDKIKKEKILRNFETVLRSKSGKSVNVIMNSRILEGNDGTLHFEGIVENITRQKELKEKLDFQKSYIENIIEKASIIVNGFNEKGELILWNRKAEEITGYQRDEVFYDQKILKMLFPDENFFNTVLKQQQEHIDKIDSQFLDMQLITKNGEIKTIRWTGMKIPAGGYNEEIILSFGLDVTETKYLENQLIQKQKLDSLGMLAGTMLNDYKKLLTHLTGQIARLRSYVFNDKFISETLKEMERSIQNRSSIISKLSEFALQKKYKMEAVDPNKIITDVADFLKNTVKNDIIIETILETNVFINADMGQIRQVLLNIALNSNDAMPNGGNLTFKTETVLAKSEPVLRNRQVKAGQYVKITVSDNGIGMNEKIQKRIFEPFFTTKADHGSLGLGLSTSYGIITKHDGFIFAQSKENKGTSLAIYLAATAKEQKNKFLHKNGETAKEKEKKYILIVDDEAIIRDLVSDVLKENDYDILTAANGEEGLEIYKKNQQIIDLIILDIIMPGISGGELFKLIREINPDMKIIITSGYSKQKVTKTIMASGANGFLPKPFNINKLLELVNTTI